MTYINIPVADNTTIFTGSQNTSSNAQTEVVLGSGWTDISGYAFQDMSATNVIIPKSLTRIGDNAFKDSALTSINIQYDSFLTTIGKSAFYDTDITEIFIPSNVTTIGDAAFESSNLTSVYMSTNTLSTLNSKLELDVRLLFNTTNNFYGKSGVTILNVETVTTFVKNRNNVRIPTFIDISGALFETLYTINNISKSDILEVIIGTSVTSIGNEAFKDAINLDKVKLDGYNNNGKNLTSIGDKAFYGTSITNITIPLSVTSIGSEAFRGNQKLTTVTIQEPIDITTPMSIGISAFMDTSLTTINIPTRVTTIETNTFANTKLTNVYIPYKVTTIGSNAFSNITKLTVSMFDVNMTILNSQEPSPNITIGVNENFYGAINATIITPSSTLFIQTNTNGVDEYTIYTNRGDTSSVLAGFIGNSHTINIGTDITTISSNFLTSNSKVTTLIIPNSVTAIDDNAFKSNTSLTQIRIPSSVRSIGDIAFNGMTNLGEINVDSSNDIFASVNGVLYNKNKTTLIRYPPGKSESKYVILNSVVTIGSYSFEALTSSVNLTIPQTVTSINANAFNIATISTIVFDVSTTVDTLGISIGDNVSFYDISTNVSFTTKVFNGIGTLTNATQDMSGGIYVDIYGYSSIGENAFLDAVRIQDVEMSISVTDICNNAFKNASSLTTVSIPSSVTSIGNDVFENTAVISIYIPPSVTNMNDNAFRGSSLTTIYMLPETATRLNIALSTSQSFYGKEAVTVYRIESTNDLIIKRIYTNLEFVTFMKTRISSTFVTTNITHTLPTVNSNNKYVSNRIQITMPDYDLDSMSIYNKKLLVDLVKTTYAREIGKHVDNIKVTLTSGSVKINIDILKDGVTESMVPICFPAGTLVTTDQGSISIEELEPDIHTIRGKPIVAITQTTPIFKHITCIQKDALGMSIPNRDVCISNEHKVFYKGKMIKATDLIGLCKNVTKVPYNGETLYNVLLEKHDKMLIHNLICETLDPENIMAKICKGNHSTATKNKIYMELNKIIKTNDVVAYKNVCDYLSKQL